MNLGPWNIALGNDALEASCHWPISPKKIGTCTLKMNIMSIIMSSWLHMTRIASYPSQVGWLARSMDMISLLRYLPAAPGRIPSPQGQKYKVWSFGKLPDDWWKYPWNWNTSEVSWFDILVGSTTVYPSSDSSSKAKRKSVARSAHSNKVDPKTGLEVGSFAMNDDHHLPSWWRDHPLPPEQWFKHQMFIVAIHKHEFMSLYFLRVC